ncbi:hypothetical protein D9M69_479640 [compost metagenome]
MRQLLLHLLHGIDQAALVAGARGHRRGEVAVGDALRDVGRVARLAAKLARQPACQEHAQHHRQRDAAQHQRQHPHPGGVIDAARFFVVVAGAIVAALDHLRHHGFQRMAVLEQVGALGEHLALELRGIQRLLADQLDILFHARAERRRQVVVLLDQRLAFRLLEGLGHLADALVHHAQRLGDLLLLGGALAHGRRRQQADLRAAGVDQVDVGVLHGLERLQVAVIDLVGPVGHAPHVDDAQQAHDGTDHRDDQESGNQPGRDAQLIEPLHSNSPL